MGLASHTYNKKDVLATNLISGNVPNTGGVINAKDVLVVKDDGSGYEVKTALTTIASLPPLGLPITNPNIDFGTGIGERLVDTPLIYHIEQSSIDFTNSSTDLFVVKNGVRTQVTSYTATLGQTVFIKEDANGNIVLYVTDPTTQGDFVEKSIPMTRAELLTLRSNSELSIDNHYLITDYNSGTIGSCTILLHATSSDQLSQNVSIKTTFDNTAWSGVYDIDDNEIIEVTDNLDNKVIGASSINTFPFGNSNVTENHIKNANFTYVSGVFRHNTLDSDSTVIMNSGNSQRNHFESLSDVTITNSDFRDNKVFSESTILTTTTGDVDSNTFSNNCNVDISGSSNIDNSFVNTDANVNITGGNVINCKFEQLSNYVMSGGVLRESTVGQDADVTIISGDNYENVFGASTVYRQYGTGYIRYSTIEGTTSWINGNTNVSNVTSYASTVNTTGSSGTISNSNFNIAYLVNCQNVSSLTITDSSVTDYSSFSVNGSSRIYLYRCNVASGSRILASAGASTRIDASYTNLSSYSYIQTIQGFIRVNYSQISSLGYIYSQSPNPNYIDRVEVSSQSRIRFLNTVQNCRVYYTNVSSGGIVEHRGTSNSCYIYYSQAMGSGQIYTNNSVNARMYYNSVSARGIIYSQNNTTTHYMYYCKASSSGYIQMLNNTGSVRLYSIEASSQSILRLQNSTASGRLYYSSFSSYYYLFLTLTGNITRSGLHGYGRRSYTVTNPPNGTFTQNF